VLFDCPGMVAESAINTLRKLALPPHVVVADFSRIQSTAAARAMMQRIVAAGGEGIMLRKPGSLYRNTRTSELLKLKPQDSF
jgi:ATP-dependent DNA ligase